MKELTDNKNRIKGLDGLRGLSILLVVIYHYGNNLIDANASQIHLYIKAMTQYFYVGVDMFFILSGFLLGGILLRNKKSPNYFKTFYLRRIFRIFPLYALILVLVFVICELGIGKGTNWWYQNEVPFWSYFTFTQNIFMGLHNSLGNAWLTPTWSLGIEEQFYIFISVLIFFTNRKNLLVILVLGILAAPVFRYNLNGEYALSAYPFCRLDDLFGGVLVAIAYEHQPFVNWFKRNLKYINRVADAMVLVAVLISVGKWQMELFISYSFYCLFFVLILLLVLIDQNSMFSRMANSKYLIQLGLYSFSIYLFHQLILGLLFFLVPCKLPQINSWSDLGIVISCAVLTFFIARFSHFVIENPFIKLGHRFKY